MEERPALPMLLPMLLGNQDQPLLHRMIPAWYAWSPPVAGGGSGRLCGRDASCEPDTAGNVYPFKLARVLRLCIFQRYMHVPDFFFIRPLLLQACQACLKLLISLSRDPHTLQGAVFGCMKQLITSMDNFLCIYIIGFKLRAVICSIRPTAFTA